MGERFGRSGKACNDMLLKDDGPVSCQEPPPRVPELFSCWDAVWWWHLESWCETLSTSWLRKYSVRTINNFLESQRWTQRSGLVLPWCLQLLLLTRCLRYHLQGPSFWYTHMISVVPTYVVAHSGTCCCTAESNPELFHLHFKIQNPVVLRLSLPNTSQIRKWEHGDSVKGSDPAVGLWGTCLATWLSKFWTGLRCM